MEDHQKGMAFPLVRKENLREKTIPNYLLVYVQTNLFMS